MMNENEIRKKIEELESEKADYDQMYENGDFNCDLYEEYDLIRGQLEAYKAVLKETSKENGEREGKKMLNEKLENPYEIGVLSGIATTLMATGISMSYCTVSLDELLYGGMFIFILMICIVFYMRYKNKAVKNNG